MRKYLAIVALVFLSSCSMKLFPLTGNYPSTPLVYHSDKSFDQVWDRLVDVFAQKGLAIKIIDRSSGLIISDNSRMPATIEDANGRPFYPEAYIAVPYLKGNGQILPASGGGIVGGYTSKKPIHANDVYGEWNVRLKKEAQGTSINVNINNLSYNSYNTAAKMNEKKRLEDYKSTGVFESQLAEMVK